MHKGTRLAVITAIGLALVYLSCTAGLGRARVRYERTRKGQAFRLSAQAAYTQEVAGCPVARREELTLDGRLIPGKSDRKDRWTVQIVLTQIRASIETPFEHLTFDTAAEETEPGASSMSERYGPYAGASLDLTMTPAGPDRSAKYRLAMKKPEAEEGEEESESEMPDIGAILRRIRGGAAPVDQGVRLAALLSGLFSEYPGKDWPVGDPWTVAAPIFPVDLAFSGGNTCKVSKADRNWLYLQVSGPLAAKGKHSSTANGRKAEISYEMSGELIGESRVSRRNGWPVERRYRTNLSGTVSRLGLAYPLRLELAVTYTAGE